MTLRRFEGSQKTGYDVSARAAVERRAVPKYRFVRCRCGNLTMQRGVGDWQRGGGEAQREEERGFAP